MTLLAIGTAVSQFHDVCSQPSVAIVLGSGLGALAELVQDRVEYFSREIAGYPVPSVPGHQGRIIAGRIGVRRVTVMQGRAHLYEGHSARRITFPLRMAQRMGATSAVITSSAGGIGMPAGTIMLIGDHMRVGPGLSPGRVGAAAPYDRPWAQRTREAALRLGINVRQGTMLWMPGPCYETPAEIRYAMRFGAHAVSMSTVPEVLEARRLQMAVLGLAVITNPAAGLTQGVLAHQDVLTAGKAMSGPLKMLLPAIVRHAPGQSEGAGPVICN